MGEYQFGIVDVPGHERFIRQMLAGATGMDLVMLVIAADDSIKQQTREHLDILRLLNVPTGIIVLTKVDLVEPDWCDLVEQEIGELVADTFLANAPIIRCSSKTGQGIEELKQQLQHSASMVVKTRSNDLEHEPFRMAIDRTFSIEGFGTVVTGSVSSGKIHVGDIVELQPSGIEARIRGLQNHDTTTDVVERGQRAAINLSGIHHDQIHRGDELAQAGHLKPARQIGVELLALNPERQVVKDRMRVRFHVGTTEVAGNLRLPPESRELAVGQRAVAILYLQEPVVAVWGQPYVIRLESPVLTLGGGRVLFANPLQTARPTQRDWIFLSELGDSDEEKRIAAAIFLLGFTDWKLLDLARLAGVASAETTVEKLLASGELKRLVITKDRHYIVHRERIHEVSDLIVRHLERMHAEHPLRLGHPVLELQNYFHYLPTPELFRSALKSLSDEKKLVVSGTAVALEGHGPQLSKGERLLFDEILQSVKRGGIAPESPEQIRGRVPKNRESVQQLFELAASSGELIKLAEDWYVHRETWGQMSEQLASAFASKPELTVSEIKAIFDVSRKLAVPLCEFLDRNGYTRRNGDVRVWVGKSDA
ncbi:MAG: selenocysteine-specific translation elongation factor [Pirellulaceae bacterium]